MHTIFWVENLKRRGDSEDLDVDGNISMDLQVNMVGGCGLDASG